VECGKNLDLGNKQTAEAAFFVTTEADFFSGGT